MLAIARGLMSNPELLIDVGEISLGSMPSSVESVTETIVRVNK